MIAAVRRAVAGYCQRKADRAQHDREAIWRFIRESQEAGLRPSLSHTATLRTLATRRWRWQARAHRWCP